MPTQQEVADHLDMTQKSASEALKKLSIDWTKSTLDEIRVAYIRHLRSVASGHKSEEGYDLIMEKVLSERVDREYKSLLVAEKRGQLVNVEQLKPELVQMVSAFRIELLSRDDKLKADLDAQYGIDVDVKLLNEYTHNAMAQLARYDPDREGDGVGAGEDVDASDPDHDHGLGDPTP